MFALIDGDILQLCYRVGFTTENDSFNIAKVRIDEYIDKILDSTKSDRFTIYLSDSTENNYRTRLYPEYKANRTQPKPVHLEGLRYYLVTEMGAELTAEQEADDALGIMQCKFENRDHTIICSIDKDLLQIPGWHHNFVRDTTIYVTKEDGVRTFYEQLLKGDKVDNIPGIYGIGDVKARKLLEKVDTEMEMFAICKEQYEKAGLTQEQLLLYGRLLKIRTKEDELWEFPTSNSEPSEAKKLLSLPETQEETSPSSEQSTTEKDGS